ncbi:hypothetical protein OIDMADRAFT_61922 [Oidiodendron maius Zn]|uniref:2EXR domain-containing protein n=1 Tax=Oidiodendron maius (strain Zn) TaxID=913774 RepID=A0A0C3GRR5_OIDMZ|nr:hypothetical protein OIDMADRAFT_61922 [Oidiodendron maius Zn]
MSLSTDLDSVESEIPLTKPKGYPETLINNTRIASYRGEQPDARTFMPFPRLPPEIRVRIWQHAISVPRIVEVKFNKDWHYRSTELPALLLCNKESRQECLMAYSIGSNGGAWIRFDWDILYLKQLDFSKDGKGFTTGSSILWSDPSDGDEDSDIWIGRPRDFEKVQALAINREVLTQSTNDYECVIRHFFPRLELLIVLVDDGITINAAWKIQNDKFEVYEDDWRESFPRWDFTRSSTGPFSTVSPANMRYEKYIEAEMEKRFKKEERNYEDYTVPFFCVRGCWLPPGIKIPECGRWPDGWTGGARVKLDAQQLTG